MLRCRTGRRTPTAAFRIAVEHATKPLLSGAGGQARIVKARLASAQYAAAARKPILGKDDAVRASRPRTSSGSSSPSSIWDRRLQLARALAGGINAVPGAACGQVAFFAHDAEARAAKGGR
ncbi:MAG: hypothetical protein U0575_14810 [Phycisphaerales bacterium]